MIGNAGSYGSDKQSRKGGGGGAPTHSNGDHSPGFAAAAGDAVVVATITPDKLVRFWTSKGVALGNLNQVGVGGGEEYTHQRL